jgi:hypothetical protein
MFGKAGHQHGWQRLPRLAIGEMAEWLKAPVC